MKKVRSTVMAAAVLIAMGTLTACGSAGSSSNAGNSSGATSTGNSTSTTTTSSASSSTLYIGLQADPPTLDPMLSTALVDRQIMLNIYDTLIALEPNGSYGPGLAKKWDVSTNGLTVTLHLQTGVKFQDGTPFNAAAVKFNLKRYMQPDSARKAQLSDITTIDTPNSSTVVLNLKKPFSPLIGILSGRSGMMVSPTAVQKEGANFANQPVGTGPYQFKDRVKGDHLTLVANNNYWQGAPKTQKVVYKIFTDPNVELTNLESGAVQLIDTVPASQLSSIQANSNFVVSNTAGLGYQGFYLNTSQAPFNNQYLREAVDAAINRQTIVNVVFKGEASPGWSPFSPASPVYNAKLDTPPAPNNALVKQYLQEGNKPNGFSFTLQTANSPISAQVAQLIQSMLAQDGIKMKIQELEFGTLLSNNTNHNFQASALGWSGRVDPDQDSYNFWYTGAPDNGSNFSNPSVDKLLQEARTVSSMSQRKHLYDQFMTVMHQQDPYIFLYYPNNTYAYSKNLQGFQPYPDGVFRLRELSLS